MENMKTGIELIANERQRQIDEEGWTEEHDAQHSREEMAIAAAQYALPSNLRYLDKSFVGVPLRWPWDKSWWKPSPENRIKELVKSGALIAAEIDRLQRLH